jgi:hypothetical protein
MASNKNLIAHTFPPNFSVGNQFSILLKLKKSFIGLFALVFIFYHGRTLEYQGTFLNVI